MSDQIELKWNELAYNKSKKPSKRNSHCVCSDDSENKTYIFGGRSKGGANNNLYVLSTDSFDRGWNLITKIRGSIPSARMDSTMCYYSSYIYLFGGNDGCNILNDFYCYNVKSKQWQNLTNKIKGNKPCIRDRHSLITINDKLYLFGGSGDDNKYLNDLFVFNPKTLIWTQIYSKNTPEPRYQHNSVSMGNYLIISCGKNEYGGLFDFWLLDTSQIDKLIKNDINNINETTLIWQRIQPKQSYIAKNQLQQRWGQSLISYNRKLIFFGGWNGKQCFNDVIIVDFGTNPFRVLLCDIIGKKPSIRTFHSAGIMKDKMVIFGGRNMTKRLYDTFYLDLKDLSGSIGYIEYNKISFNKYEINTKINQRYAISNYIFEFENTNDNGIDELRFEFTIQPNAFITKFIADINGTIYNGKIIKQKEEIKENNHEKDIKKENGILIFQPYKDINNIYEIKTNIKCKTKVKLNIQIEQFIIKKCEYNELKIEILRNFEMYNIKRNHRYIAFKYDISDINNIYDVSVPGNDIRVNKTTIDKCQCFIDGKIMCSKNNSSSNELILKYKTKIEKQSNYVLYDRNSSVFCHVISDVISDNMNGVNGGVKKKVLIPRRVIFAVDKSGSMCGNKWNKTIDSVVMSLNKLRNGYDRFALIFFNEDINIFPNNGMMQTNDENIQKSIRYLENNKPIGSTNINDAIIGGINLIKNDIKCSNIKNKNNFFINQIIVITDGEPNKGIKDVQQIILNVEKENVLSHDKYNNKVSIFTFGIGSDDNNSLWIKDLNHSFLKILALKNNGFYKRIKQCSADIKFNQYFNILSKPILSNINIKYNNKHIKCLTNTKLNTLYNGNDIIICGKINKKNGSNMKHMNIEMNISAITGKETKKNNIFMTKPIEIYTNIKANINLEQSNENNERIWTYFQLKQFEENRLINDNNNDEKQQDISALSLAIKYSYLSSWTYMIVDGITSLHIASKRKNGLKNGYHRRMSLRATSDALTNDGKKYKNCSKLFVDSKHKNKKLKLNDFELKSTLGTGSFGRVRLVKYEAEYFAMKMMRKTRVIAMKQENHIKSELSILRSLNHPFIVNLIASFQDKSYLYLILELVSGGEFFTLLKRAEKLELAHCRFYGSQIVLIFQFLHHNKIVYRDLKPENLLIDTDGFLRLTDFGFAKKLKKPSYRTWTLCGTPEYIAPEILLNRGHSFSVDWWSLGILLFEMFTGSPPFIDDNPMAVYQKILNCKIIWPEDKKKNQYIIPRVGREFISRLLCKNISQRIGNLEQRAVDVMKHPFFKGVNWKQMLEKSVQKVPWKPEIKSKEDTKHFDDYDEDSDGDDEELTNDPFLNEF